ncbi:MAG: lysophospholipase L1-like esterase [Pseudohongiellaceae bacterium]
MRVRRRRSRLAAILILVILVELALQFVAPLVRSAMSRERDLANPDATLTVLCVGDSNTFGLHLPRVYAYPAMLQAALGQRYRQPVSVINRGIPGQNSAQVAAGLLQDLDELSPDIVFILAGINDTWNTDGQDLGWSSIFGQIKLVRLAKVLATGVTSATTFEISTDDQGEILVNRGEGQRRINQGDKAGAIGLKGAELALALQRGLGQSLDACREAGSIPVLMTYAESAGPFAEVNARIREYAAQQDVLLVDHGLAFESHFAARGYKSLMFADHHPNARGYRLMALDADSALASAQLVPSRLPAEERWVHEQRSLSQPPTLNVGLQGDLELRGPPGWAYQVVVACASQAVPAEMQGPRDPGAAVSVPLVPDEIMALARLEPSFSGRFDDTGSVAVPVPRALRAAATCPLAACLLLLRDDPQSLLAENAQSVEAVSEVVVLP